MSELFSLPESRRPPLVVPALPQPGAHFQPPPIVPDRADPQLAFREPMLPDCFARIFAPLPPEPIWRWAEQAVWLKNEVTSKPGPYSSDQTPWTRRLQELIRDPVTIIYDRNARAWRTVNVTRIWIKKCSQSGFTEACLNGIRWSAKHRPRSTIFAIDIMKEARKISERLESTLSRLGEEIFTGYDDDVGTYLMRLRQMRVYFLGSFSGGAFANKFAAMCFADEVDEHGKLPGDTDTLSNLASRFKTADDGFIVGLSKPKKSSGPITKAHATGNCEEQFIRCPHCHQRQPLTFFGDASDYPELRYEIPFDDEVITVTDEQTGRTFRTWTPLPLGQTRKIKAARLRFDHCRDLLGGWDKTLILTDTFAECGYCAGRINEDLKPHLVAAAEWLPTAIGDPGVISQHCHDLLSSDKNSSWGRLVLRFLSDKEDRVKLQGFWNHVLGLDFKEEASEVDENDIRRNMGLPYLRGQVPFPPSYMVLGSDIGETYARWVLCAVRKDGAMAVVDWGNEGAPLGVAEVVTSGDWPLSTDPGKKYKVSLGFMCAKYRRLAVQSACLSTNGIMFPAAGGGSNTQRRPFNWNIYEKGLPRWFGYLTFNDHDCKSSLYIDRYKKRSPGIFFPQDVFAKENSERFVEEITKETLVTDPETGECAWDDKHPNHFGDALKLCDLAHDWIFRPRKPKAAAAAAERERLVAAAAASGDTGPV